MHGTVKYCEFVSGILPSQILRQLASETEKGGVTSHVALALPSNYAHHKIVATSCLERNVINHIALFSE